MVDKNLLTLIVHGDTEIIVLDKRIRTKNGIILAINLSIFIESKQIFVLKTAWGEDVYQ